MCLPYNYNKSDLFHKATHIRHRTLDKQGSDFSARWKQISNLEYGNVREIGTDDILITMVWDDGSGGPKHGCIEPYGGTNILEDVAHYLEPLGYQRNPDDVIKSGGIFVALQITEFSIRGAQLSKKVDEITQILKSPQKLENAKGRLKKLLKEELRMYAAHSTPFYFCDKTDKRYQQKIDLLREYDFISKKQHKWICKHLGCLRYLLDASN